jgi:hypothetical protein
MPQETLIACAKNAPVLHSFGGVDIVRIAHNLVLKSGTSVLASEGETMSYVIGKFPEVRLPKVYRYFNIDCSMSYSGSKAT